MVSSIVKRWQDKNIKNKTDLINVLDKFQIMFACNSTRIEGNVVTYSNVKNIFKSGVVKNYTGPVTDLIEIINQKRAFDYLADCFEKKEPLSVELLLKLHRLLLKDCLSQELLDKGELPGSFKKNDYCVGTNEVGEEPEFVHESVIELFDEINSTETSDILMVATYLHATFESIHPFADGNGRVGRCITNYFLVLNNYPPIVLDVVDKETYYMAFEVYNRTEDLKGFKMFMEEQLVKTWSSLAEEAVTSNTLTRHGSDAVVWLREVVPDMFKDLPDKELLEMFGSMYTKYRQGCF